MKYSITGEIEVLDDLTHQEFLSKFYTLLKAYNMFFVGETKMIQDKDIFTVKDGVVQLDFNNPVHVDIYEKWTKD